jgi:PAS domain S-box-containing protein
MQDTKENKKNIMPAMASSRPESEPLNIQLLVDSIPALIHTARPDGYLDYFNKPWLEYLGVTLDKVSGWNWTAFIHPEELDGIVARWRACLASGEIFEYETRVRRANGEYRWMFHRKVPLRSDRGNIVKWYGSSMDIDERKTAEVELRRSKAHLADAQRLSRTGSVGMEGSTKRIFWSEEAARIYGYPPGTEPTPDLILQRAHPDDVGLVKDALERAAQGGSDFDYEHRLLMPDGSIKHLHDLAHCFRDESGNEEVVGAMMDITERKVAEEAIRRSEAYLAEAQKLSHTGSFGWKPDTGEIVWSDESYRIFEYDRTEKPTLNRVFERIHPQDKAPAQQVVEAVSAKRHRL